MKAYKTIISSTIGLIILMGLAVLFYRLFNSNEQTTTTTASPDPRFTSATETHLRPTSVPFEKKDKPIVPEPNNVPQTQIAHTYRIIKTDSTGHKDTTSLILLKNGQALTDNHDHKVSEFLEQTYLPPIVAFDWFPKIGINGTLDKVTPMVAIGFAEFYGKLQFPVFSVDLQGMGLGVDYKIADPISVGVLYHTNWQTNKSIRLMMNYNF